jgi:glycosyltransferase involved in cell wall biosynthesis
MKIEYICFTNQSGFAFAAKNNILSLIQRGHDVRIKPIIGSFNKQINQNYEFLNKLISDKTEKDAIQIFHAIPDILRKYKQSEKAIGYAIFETENPPLHWNSYLNKNKFIVSPSLFCYNEFKKTIPEEKLFYIPHCLDFNIYKPGKKENKNVFKFLFIGTWKERKGYRELLSAFQENFSSNEGVELHIKTANNSALDPVVFTRNYKKNGERIFCNTKMISDEEMPEFIKQYDCLILPSYGEGFGYPVLQALACGIPAIFPNHTGLSEFVIPGLEELAIPYEKKKIKNLDGYSQFSNKAWFCPDAKAIGDKMRLIYSNREKFAKIVETGYNSIQEKFSYRKSAELWEKLFQKI